MPGYGDSSRQGCCRAASSPYVGMTQIAEQQHGSLAFARTFNRFYWERRQAGDDFARLIGSKQLRQTASRFFPGVEFFGKAYERILRRQKTALGTDLWRGDCSGH